MRIEERNGVASPFTDSDCFFFFSKCCFCFLFFGFLSVVGEWEGGN